MPLPCTAIILIHQDTPQVWQCLGSVNWIKSILVIDNQSKIPSKQFYDSGVSQVFALPDLITDYAAVRNLGMSKVTTPWCFFIDSDEIVDDPSPSALEDLALLMNDAATAGIIIRRSDIFLDKKLSYGEAGNQPLVRLMRPSATHWVGKAHEKPVVNGQVQHSDLTISHYSHKSINSFITDISNYAKIVASERKLSQTQNLLQLLCFPPMKLLYDLVLLGAILDGWRGVTYSYCMALHSLLVRIYWYEQHTSLVSQSNTSRPS